MNKTLGGETSIIQRTRQVATWILLLAVILTSTLVSPVRPAYASNAQELSEQKTALLLPIQINFNDYPPTPFGGQDVNPTMTIEDGGNTLHLKGNSWKKISFPYTVTPYTVLEFDFKSPVQAEVQGIGFDNDEGLSPGYAFQVYGTQSWGSWWSFFTYTDPSQEWKHYRIPAGQYYTGNMLYIVFANDHDVSNPTGESYFKNVTVYEESGTPAQPPVNVNFMNYSISNYSGQTAASNFTMTIEDGGQTLHMIGNGWQKISLPYTVTSSTVIEFDFKSGSQGEVQGIGFDIDNSYQQDRTFRLYGTQGWGMNPFAYSIYAPDWKHFRIPVGKYYTGEMRYLFFANDHDISNPTSENYFKNLTIYEGEVSLPVSIDFDQYAISPEGAPTVSVEDNGNTIHLTQGNAWKQISMPVSILPDTVLEFDFKSTSQGDVHGIGLDTVQGMNSIRTFMLYGTQGWGITDFNDYAISAPEWKHYIIPVGQYYQGQMLYLFFFLDHDVANPTGESYFSNIQIHNGIPAVTATFTPTNTATNTPTFTPTFTPTATITNTPTSTPQDSWRLGNYQPDAYGVRADITTPNQAPFLQESGESNWVSLPTPYWVQAGWRYYKGWIWAWSYVESFSPATGYEIREYSIHNWGQIVEYKVEWTGGTTWCGWIDGVNKACYDAQSAPITVSARSEIHVSSQNQLDTYFWMVSYMDGNNNWYFFDQALWQESPPYSIDKSQYYNFHNYGP